MKTLRDVLMPLVPGKTCATCGGNSVRQFETPQLGIVTVCDDCEERATRAKAIAAASLPYSECCAAGASIQWRKADSNAGPEETGWSTCVGGTQDGEKVYDNINFCPWCGVKLSTLEVLVGMVRGKG